MLHNKTRVVFVLFAVLGLLYFVNIYLTKSLSDVFIDSPAKLLFATIEPPKDVCNDCFDANTITEMIDKAHNVKYKSRRMPYDSELSQKYIEMYGINNLPAVVVSGDIENENVASAWEALSGRKKNGSIIIENLLPYYDIESGRVKGIVSVLLVKDETCEDCFDENDYINILGRFGMTIGSTVVYDIASEKGGALVKKYAITKVPALILSPDTNEYSSLVSSWGEVGTIEKDGWFVFREVQKLNPQYKQL